MLAYDCYLRRRCARWGEAPYILLYGPDKFGTAVLAHAALAAHQHLPLPVGYATEGGLVVALHETC